MKITVKIYHILHAKLKKGKQAGDINKNYLDGYRQALLDSVQMETKINQNRIDYVVKNNNQGYIITPK